MTTDDLRDALLAVMERHKPVRQSLVREVWCEDHQRWWATPCRDYRDAAAALAVLPDHDRRLRVRVIGETLNVVASAMREYGDGPVSLANALRESLTAAALAAPVEQYKHKKTATFDTPDDDAGLIAPLRLEKP